jgi:hypothetical protein
MNKDSPMVVVKELIQFHRNSSLPVARVNEDILRLALCLITKELELAIDPFLANWSLKTLSQAPDSILYLQLALGYLEKVFLPIKVSRTNRQAQQESEQRAKLASKILATGCIRNLLWMLLHPDNDISNLSCKMLKRLLCQSAKFKSQHSSQITYLDIDKPSAVRQLLKQSLVPILFGAKEALKDEIDPDDRIHLLEQITTKIRQTVNRLLNKGSPADDAIKELVGNEDSQDSIQSCTGLLLIQCTETFHRDVYVVKILIEKVLSTVTQQPNFVQSSEIFWHAIESVIDSGSVAFRDTETNARTMQSLSDGTTEPVEIIFKSVDGEAPMELPSLVTLRNMIPKLAMQVRSVAIEQQ